jgi:hypothetical protein
VPAACSFSTSAAISGRDGAHLVEAAVEGADQLVLVGMEGLQAARRLGGSPP